ncbi:MAG: sugar phosphate isomerase/epimerase family protein [Isosphaeraceae bacterium]
MRRPSHGRTAARHLALLAAITWWGASTPTAHAQVRSAEPPADRWRLACRLASYGKFQSQAWSHLPTLGVRYLFLPVPDEPEVAAVEEKLKAHRLSPLVVRGHGDLGEPKCLEGLSRQLATCERMGVRYLFFSPRHTGVAKEAAYERLRQAGDIARRHGVTIALETHPDLGTNAEVHLETMRRVDHPNVRVNFDTGNITYYNAGADVVAELKKVIDYVATVELKDHGGRPKTWDFPALGQGKLDLKGVIAVLREHHYAGPITIEVEGVEGKPWNEAETRQAVADSVAYLRRLGAFE